MGINPVQKFRYIHTSHVDKGSRASKTRSARRFRRCLVCGVGEVPICRRQLEASRILACLDELTNKLTVIREQLSDLQTVIAQLKRQSAIRRSL